MKEILTIISLAVGIVSVLIVVLLNLNTLSKIRKQSKEERALEESMRLGVQMENTQFGKAVLSKLNAITEAQDVYSQSLLHILRTDLIALTDEVMYINRMRNTKSSKWNDLGLRLRRFEVLEETMDACFASYKRLGGNCFIEDRYKEAKEVIKKTLRQAEG